MRRIISVKHRFSDDLILTMFYAKRGLLLYGFTYSAQPGVDFLLHLQGCEKKALAVVRRASVIAFAYALSSMPWLLLCAVIFTSIGFHKVMVSSGYVPAPPPSGSGTVRSCPPG